MSDAEPRTTPGTRTVLADADDPDADAMPYQEAEVKRAIWRMENLRQPDVELPPDAPRPQHYSLVIRWSDADGCFVAWMPEFGVAVKTHGTTYAEAAAKGQEVIEMMADGDPQDLPLPVAWKYDEPERDEQIGQHLLRDNIHYTAFSETDSEQGE